MSSLADDFLARTAVRWGIAFCVLSVLIGLISPWASVSGVPASQQPHASLSSMFPRTEFFRSIGFVLWLVVGGLAGLNFVRGSKGGWIGLALVPLFLSLAFLGWTAWRYLEPFTHEPYSYGPPVPVDIAIAWGVKLLTVSAAAGAALSLLLLALRDREPA